MTPTKKLLVLLSSFAMLGAMTSINANAAPSGSSRAKPFPHISLRSANGRESLNIGGALRTNLRYEDWKTSSNRSPHFRFDTFRLDLHAKYGDFFADAGYWFQDNYKHAIDRAYLGYHLDHSSSVQVGAPFKPFGLQPYPQNGWSYHLPFFLGFARNAGLGAKYLFKGDKWDLQAGFFPRMMVDGLRYAPAVGRYSKLDNTIPFTEKGQDNEKRNQVNVRVVRHFSAGTWDNQVGASVAASQLHNNTTGDNGSFWAAAIHGVFSTGPWAIQTQALRYEYDPKNPAGISNDSVLMGANGEHPAYLIASKATVGSFNVSYGLPTPGMGMLKKVKFYNDYSHMWKDKSGWSDSQMDTIGAQFLAMPIIAWVDLTWAKNANPYGGAENGTGFTSTTSSGSNQWYFRTNVNIGYYF